MLRVVLMRGSDINDMRTLSLVLRGLLHRLLHNKLANIAKSIVQYSRSATSCTRRTEFNQTSVLS